MGLLTQADPSAYYGLASDHNNGGAKSATASHTHRFEDGGELKTMVRQGSYERDQRASAIRRQPTNKDGTSCSAAFVPGSTTTRQTALFGPLTDASVLCRGTNNQIQDMQTTYLQSDYSKKFEGLYVQDMVQVAPQWNVLVGRPVVYGLANAGAVGVAHVLRIATNSVFKCD